MVFTALTLTASAQSYWLVERLSRLDCELSVYFDHQRHAVCPALRHFYLPLQVHTLHEVRLSSALVGGAVAGFYGGRRNGICRFVANSARSRRSIRVFCHRDCVLIWMYTGWLIFLIGAEVTYFHQYPSAFLYEAMTDGKGYRFQSGWLSQHWLRCASPSLASTPWEQTELAARFGVSSLGNLIDDLVRSSILLKSEEPEGVALARPPETFL